MNARAGSKRERLPLNGVDTPALFATINAVREQPELAQFTFRARNRWVEGANSRTEMTTFSGAGGDHVHVKSYAYDADHPKVLVGKDKAPTPVEFLLHALAACLTAGIGNVAAARGVKLTSVQSTIEGEMDLRGILGLSDEVRNGYQRMKVRFDVAGDASPEKLREIVQQSQARSAVFDVITHPVLVEVTVNAG